MEETRLVYQNRPTKDPMSETKHQITLVKASNLIGVELIANMNGGARVGKSASIAKFMGLRSGVPDLMHLEGRGGFFGLFLEMKQNRNYTASERNTKTWFNQEEWLHKLTQKNYYATRAFGWEHGLSILREYLAWPITPILQR